MNQDRRISEFPESSGAELVADVPAEHAREDYDISLLDLLIVLARKKRTIYWIMAVFTVLGTLLAFLLPKRYTATVTLLPPRQEPSLSTALASQLGSLGGIAALVGGEIGLKNPNDMYVAMFQSHTVEDAMIRHFGLMQEYHKRYLSDARKEFEHYAIVDGSNKDGLIHISVEDGDPHRAAKLANGYVDEFRELSQHLAITEAGQRVLFFQHQNTPALQHLCLSSPKFRIAPRQGSEQ